MSENLKNNKSEKNDLDLIKKYYGEEFMRLCRKLFPEILENKGDLFKIITEYFDPNRTLAKDIEEQGLEYDFQNFVNLKFRGMPEKRETPFEIMKQEGYTLYECKSNEDILAFKKYYHPEEELSTFYDSKRINENHIFFAVIDKVNEIKREDYYANRRRGDAYGTSVISLQFEKPEKNDNERTSSLSIKSRWNHSVTDPDATFFNDLDRIHPGLARSFEEYLNENISDNLKVLPLANYTRDEKGKFYKYNEEVNGRYFCGNNTIISKGEVYRFNPDRYLLVDNYLIDKKNNKMIDVSLVKDLSEDHIQSLFDNKETKKGKVVDSFLESLGDIKKIEVRNFKHEAMDFEKIIYVTTSEGKAVIYINQNNSMVEYNNLYVKEIGDDFLSKAPNLRIVVLPETKGKVGKRFCLKAKEKSELAIKTGKSGIVNFNAYLNSQTGERGFAGPEDSLELELPVFPDGKDIACGPKTSLKKPDIARGPKTSLKNPIKPPIKSKSDKPEEWE